MPRAPYDAHNSLDWQFHTTNYNVTPNCLYPITVYLPLKQKQKEKTQKDPDKELYAREEVTETKR
jgi:hypothetical protein